MIKNKVKINFAVHEKLQKELRERTAKSKYGLNGKSRWVSEAIETLLKMGNYSELVVNSGELHGFDKKEIIIIDKNMKNKLNNAIIEIRKQFPLIQGLQSMIVRTAIIQRFLKNN